MLCELDFIIGEMRKDKKEISLQNVSYRFWMDNPQCEGPLRHHLDEQFSIRCDSVSLHGTDTRRPGHSVRKASIAKFPAEISNDPLFRNMVRYSRSKRNAELYKSATY